MTFLSEFSYSNIYQRRIVIFNTLITFIALGLIYINASIILKYYFIYQPILQIVFVTALIGIFIGNLLGKFIFPRITKHRIIYAIIEILFILSCYFYIYSELLIKTNSIHPLLSLFFNNQFYTIIPLFIISFFAGLKINYFLKISCGDFIDGKRAVISFLLSMILGTILGIMLSITLYYYKDFFHYSGILLLLIIPSIFLIKLSYNPKPIYAQEIKDHASESEKTEKDYKRDDLFFIYLNFTYILIYLFLTFTSIVKYLGDFLHIKLTFIIISLISIAFGFIIARIARQAFWYIYSEMLYPVFFLISLVSLLFFKDLSPLKAICLFIPVSIILGFSLCHSIDHILSVNNHKNRFNVIGFSIFILPAPILISLIFIDFTYLWYFVLLYSISLLNIFIPGIYLMQTKIKGYKKLIYFILVLIFIPLLILMHMYFNISLNNNFYIAHTTGFESLNLINYNSQYINTEGTIYINGIKSFYADDPSIRNMKRSITPALLYTNNNDEILFIDGNRKFFKNPAISLYKNATCLDYVPRRQVDNKTLSLSGDQNYVLVNSNILSYFDKRESLLKMIIDIPNLYDQALNAFRFSKDYYNIIKNYLVSEGIYIQTIDISSCRNDFIAYAGMNLKDTFKNIIGFYFPKYIVFIASNDDNALIINPTNIKSLKESFETKPELKNLFYNEIHLLSHILFLDIDKMIDSIDNIDKKAIDPFFFLHNIPKKFIIDNTVFSDDNSKFLSLIKDNDSNVHLLYSMKKQLAINNPFLSDLKKAELYEADREYENESMQLIKLKKQSEYLPDLRKYILDILSYKEDYYFNAALKFEKDKKWESARKLYKAILTINKNNFEANLGLGNLSIILQDLNSSFEYLQYAMKLKKDDPKVLYQMGVLLFSNGRPGEALIYLEKALEFKERSASLFYYLGLCYEELGNLYKAKVYYDKAMILDPNDKNIISGIERIKLKNNLKLNENKANENTSHTEVEQGEDMPLPVSDAAKKVRIEEEEKNR